MKKNFYLYISFLEESDKRGGGHIETNLEINEYKKIFSKVDILFANKSKNLNQNLLNKNYIYSKPFNKYIPIFGKRPYVSSRLLEKYEGVIIADARCFIPFIISILNRKKVFFKSHGSLAIYFWSFLISNIFLINYRPHKAFLKIFYYLPVIFIFSFVEIIIYCFSYKIYIMRSEKSITSSYFGRLFHFFFSHKTEFSFCPSLLEYDFKGNSNLKVKFKNNQKFINLLIFGNWELPHNFASLLDFLKRLNPEKQCSVNLIGKIHKSQVKIIRKLKSKANFKCNILGYVENLNHFKKNSTHVISCANYGSGIPIKCLEIILQANEFDYIPIVSSYCKKALDGILNIKYRTYPSKGLINIS